MEALTQTTNVATLDGYGYGYSYGYGNGCGYGLSCPRKRKSRPRRSLRPAMEKGVSMSLPPDQNDWPFAPDAFRADLFSRASRPGWTGWGDEHGKFDREHAA